MPTHHTEAIILLYPSQTQAINELRKSASDFCQEHNIVVTDVINLCDEYDYFAMRRLAQILAYRTTPIALVTNRSILATIPPLTLWSVLDAAASTKSIELIRNLLYELKDSALKANHRGLEDFYMLNHREVSHISDWLESMKYGARRGGS